MLEETVTIDRRFCGPARSGNGGYVCGIVASRCANPANVILRRPPPLERPLTLTGNPGDNVELLDGDVLIAEARPLEPTGLDLDVPEPPTYDEAVELSRLYPGFDQHPFISCFVCGPKRAEEDGLRIFPGRIGRSERVAAPWTPHESLADRSGRIPDEFLWAALDCPGAFAAMSFPSRPAVLGSLAASLGRPPEIGERCVVVGWGLGQDGRKYLAGTAIFTESRRLCAKAKAVWIELKKP